MQPGTLGDCHAARHTGSPSPVCIDRATSSSPGVALECARPPRLTVSLIIHHPLSVHHIVHCHQLLLQGWGRGRDGGSDFALRTEWCASGQTSASCHVPVT